MLRVVVIFLVLVLAAASPNVARSEEPAPAAWMGVLLGAPRATPGETEREPGALITGVVEDGPAERAGLRARDRVVSLDGSPLTGASDLIARVKALSPDSWVTVEIARGEDVLSKRIRLGERPAATRGLRMRRGWIGLRAIGLPTALREHFGAPAEAGVMISEVEPDSPAEAAGFLLADVIHEVDGEAIATPEDLQRAIQTGGVGNSMTFTLLRDGAEMLLEAIVETEPPREQP